MVDVGKDIDTIFVFLQQAAITANRVTLPNLNATLIAAIFTRNLKINIKKSLVSPGRMDVSRLFSKGKILRPLTLPSLIPPKRIPPAFSIGIAVNTNSQLKILPIRSTATLKRKRPDFA